MRFEEDTLRQRPLWIRIIIEFVGTFLLVTVAAGAGVINHYAGGSPGPISRAAAAVAPGLLVMALIYAWGPLSGRTPTPRAPSPSGGPGAFRQPRFRPTRLPTSSGPTPGPHSCAPVTANVPAARTDPT